jgi:hypothetical protein
MNILKMRKTKIDCIKDINTALLTYIYCSKNHSNVFSTEFSQHFRKAFFKLMNCETRFDWKLDHL